MAVRGGCWFALGDRQLHLGAETDFRPAKKAHVALALEGLDALRARIEAAGHATHDDSIIDGRHRFFTEDPFGNRIDFMDRTTHPCVSNASTEFFPSILGGNEQAPAPAEPSTECPRHVH